MIDRRSFLNTAFGLPFTVGANTFAANPVKEAGEALPPVLTEMWKYERILVGSSNRELIGIPRSWSLVLAGFHPFTPERIVVWTPSAWARYGSLASSRIKDQIRQRLLKRCLKADEPMLSEEKLDLLVGIIDRLTAFYRVPEYFEKWAERLAVREQLGSTGLGRGFGLFHQFQDWQESFTSVVNPPVDWWLFLFPDGADYESIDGKPVHAVFGHVLARRHPASELGILHLASQLGRDLLNGSTEDSSPLIELAKMDRPAIARLLNQRLAGCLRQVTK